MPVFRAEDGWLGRGENRVPFALGRRDVEQRRHTARTGACQHRVLLLGKSLVVEVTVRIDEHQATVSPSPSGNARRGKIGIGWPTAKPLAASFANQPASASAA